MSWHTARHPHPTVECRVRSGFRGHGTTATPSKTKSDASSNPEARVSFRIFVCLLGSSRGSTAKKEQWQSAFTTKERSSLPMRILLAPLWIQKPCTSRQVLNNMQFVGAVVSILGGVLYGKARQAMEMEVEEKRSLVFKGV